MSEELLERHMLNIELLRVGRRPAGVVESGARSLGLGGALVRHVAVGFDRVGPKELERLLLARGGSARSVVMVVGDSAMFGEELAELAEREGTR